MKFRKIIPILFLLPIIIALLSLSASAEDDIVYIKDGGTGDGSSPDEAAGSFYEIKDSAAHTICICGKLTVEEYYFIGGDKKITAFDGKTDFRNSGASIIFGGENGSGNVCFGGNCVVENIDIVSAADRERYFICSGKDVTFGDGIVCKKKNTGCSYVSLVMGNIESDINSDYKITVKSGTFGSIYFNRDSVHNGNAEINIYGGSILKSIGGEINVNGFLALNLSGGSVFGNILLNCNYADINIENCSLDSVENFILNDSEKGLSKINVSSYKGNKEKLKELFSQCDAEIILSQENENVEKDGDVEETTVNTSPKEVIEKESVSFASKKEIIVFFGVLAAVLTFLLGYRALSKNK